MAGLESLRTPEEVAELRGLSVNAVLGLTESNGDAESASTSEAPANGSGAEEESLSARGALDADADPAPSADIAAPDGDREASA
jgi:small subunit ribosomal protein S5